MDCYSPPGSSVHGIFQARILEWVAIPFARGSSRPRDWTWVFCISSRFFKFKKKKKSDSVGNWLLLRTGLWAETASPGWHWLSDIPGIPWLNHLGLWNLHLLGEGWKKGHRGKSTWALEPDPGLNPESCIQPDACSGNVSQTPSTWPTSTLTRSFWNTVFWLHYILLHIILKNIQFVFPTPGA